MGVQCTRCFLFVAFCSHFARAAKSFGLGDRGRWRASERLRNRGRRKGRRMIRGDVLDVCGLCTSVEKEVLWLCREGIDASFKCL